MAGQVKVDPELYAEFDFTSRQAVNHRKQIREFYGFREITVGDEDKQIVWLAEKVCPIETSRDRLRAALLTRCRQEKIEPPKPGQVERLLGAAEAMFERRITTGTVQRLPASAATRLKDLLQVPETPTPTPTTSRPRRRPGAGAASCRS